MSGPYALTEITIRIINVTAEAYERFGEKVATYIAGRPLPGHDYRIEVEADNGARQTRVTFGAGERVSADDILAHLNA